MHGIFQQSQQRQLHSLSAADAAHIRLPHGIGVGGFSPIEEVKFLAIGSSSLVSIGDKSRINTLDDLTYTIIAWWFPSLFFGNLNHLAMNRGHRTRRIQQAYREERLARYEQVVTLRKLGMSQAAIAKRVGMGQSTVGNWLAAGAYPETTRGPYVSRIDPYLPYLFERWESGCHNMVRLHQELVARGYKGSYASVRDHLVRRLPEGRKNSSQGNELSPAPLPSRQATFLFLRRPETLTPEEQADLLTLRQSHPEVDQAYDLVEQFVQMLRTRSGEQLDTWLAKVAESQIPEFQSFLLDVERDKPAVVAGLTLPYSNGIVEGKVNKLKLIKRMGYGRAGLYVIRNRSGAHYSRITYIIRTVTKEHSE